MLWVVDVILTPRCSRVAQTPDVSPIFAAPSIVSCDGSIGLPHKTKPRSFCGVGVVRSCDLAARVYGWPNNAEPPFMRRIDNGDGAIIGVSHEAAMAAGTRDETLVVDAPGCIARNVCDRSVGCTVVGVKLRVTD